MALSDAEVSALRIHDLGYLAPRVRKAAIWILDAVPDASVEETLRVQALQTEYKARGTSGQGNVLLSSHGHGAALDFTRKGTWPPDDDPWWITLSEAVKKSGLYWGGDWQHPKDRPHAQGGWPGVVPQQAVAMFQSGGLVAVWDYFKLM